MPSTFHPVAALPSSVVEDMYAVADALFAKGPDDEARVRWAVNELCDLLVRAGTRGSRTYRAALFGVSLLAPLFIKKLPPLRKLSRADRISALEKFENHPLGAPLFVVKSMLCISYYEHPEAARQVGWDTRPLVAKGVAR